MLTEHRVILVLRFFLVCLFAIIVMLQTLSFPGQFAWMAEETPAFEPFRWPATAVTAFWLLCLEVVIVATWKLLTLVDRDRIFSENAFVWVNTIVRAIGAAWLLLAAVFVFVLLNADDPGLPVLLALLLTGVAVVGLLMVVMRALLRRATTLHADLEAVI